MYRITFGFLVGICQGHMKLCQVFGSALHKYLINILPFAFFLRFLLSIDANWLIFFQWLVFRNVWGELYRISTLIGCVPVSIDWALRR